MGQSKQEKSHLLNKQDLQDILNLIGAVAVPFSQVERAVELKRKIEFNIENPQVERAVELKRKIEFNIENPQE